MAAEVPCVRRGCDNVQQHKGSLSFCGCFLSKETSPRRPPTDLASSLLARMDSCPTLSQSLPRGLGLPQDLYLNLE